MKFSIILPTLNESQNIVKLINQIIIVMDSKNYEIIVVDDNSIDKTFEIVKEKFKKNEKIKYFIRKKNRSFAKSIRLGIEKSTGNYLVIMDSDLTHNPYDIPKLIEISKLYVFVICSRFAAGGKMQDKKHYFASLFFNFYLRMILSTQVQDNLGGYYIISRKELFKINFDKVFYGYGDYFFRLIYFLQKNNITLIEIPSKYLLRGKGQSKSNWIRMIFSYSFQAIKLRILS